jgi:quercetin dioxygenase-like cupin family protein
MDLHFEKQVEDIRGKIFFFAQGNKRFNLVEMKKDFARGGHYHNFEQMHIILTGKIEYHKKDPLMDKEDIEIINSLDSVLIPAKTPHLFIALEDSSFIETYEDSYESTEYPEFRRIVEERMKTS